MDKEKILSQNKKENLYLDEYEVRFLVDLMKSAKIAFRKSVQI